MDWTQQAKQCFNVPKPEHFTNLRDLCWHAHRQDRFPGAALCYQLGDGHTHVSMVERVDRVTVINPGSCAQPRDQDRCAPYASLDLGRREVELHRVRLD